MRLAELRLPLRRGATRRTLLGAAALAFVAIGLIGATSYWESYYHHRGFTPPERIAHAGVGHLQTVQFYSSALGRRAQYLVYLPPGYSPEGRYPVLYLLHGSPGRPQLFFDVGNVGVRLDNLLAEHAVQPMILVAPDGRIGGSQFSDSEWADTRYGRFESYVVETVHDVDSRFATIPDRRARVIAGYSEGGYGALNIALHHLGVFGSVQVWSGYYLQPHPAGPFRGASRATLAYNSPRDFVARDARTLKRLPLNVFIYGGRNDPASVLIRPMVRLLRRDHVLAQYAIYRGGHDWQLWNAHLDQMLALAGREATGGLGSEPPYVLPASAPPASALPASAPPALARPPAAAHRVTRGLGTGGGGLLAGLLLALLSAAAINLGFLFQHRGLSSARSLPGDRFGLIRAMARNRSWLGGQTLGWAGFATQILAVTIAPLSLVQSFAAGGLALSVPLAARLFGHRISRRQQAAVLLVAVGLAALPIGLSVHGDNLAGDRLTITTGLVLAAALGIGAIPAAPMRAIASGLFYGVADAAIKAVSVRWGGDGAGALLSGWTLLALAATFAGFISFQAALRAGSAVATISLMNCLAALVALLGGLVAFGETLGNGAAAWALHFLAIGLVLACVPVLASAQAELAESGELPGPLEELGPAGAGPPARRAAFGLWPARPAWNHATDGEQHRLEPGTGAGAAGEERVPEAHVASG